MFRLLRRRGNLSCRGSYILMFSLLVAASMLVLFQLKSTTQSVLPKAASSKFISHGKQKDISAKCSETNCLTQEECNSHQVKLIIAISKEFTFKFPRVRDMKILLYFCMFQAGREFEDIACRINNEVMKNTGLVTYPGYGNQTKGIKSGHNKTIKCKLNTSDKEVYVPFSFIKSYFDVSF